MMMLFCDILPDCEGKQAMTKDGVLPSWPCVARKCMVLRTLQKLLEASSVRLDPYMPVCTMHCATLLCAVLH
jgi:hypothetical protein